MIPLHEDLGVSASLAEGLKALCTVEIIILAVFGILLIASAGIPGIWVTAMERRIVALIGAICILALFVVSTLGLYLNLGLGIVIGLAIWLAFGRGIWFLIRGK